MINLNANYLKGEHETKIGRMVARRGHDIRCVILLNKYYCRRHRAVDLNIQKMKIK